MLPKYPKPSSPEDFPGGQRPFRPARRGIVLQAAAFFVLGLFVVFSKYQMCTTIHSCTYSYCPSVCDRPQHSFGVGLLVLGASSLVALIGLRTRLRWVMFFLPSITGIALFVFLARLGYGQGGYQ
jgi:hypothetical protein